MVFARETAIDKPPIDDDLYSLTKRLDDDSLTMITEQEDELVQSSRGKPARTRRLKSWMFSLPPIAARRFDDVSLAQ